ncbi:MULTISPECIES: type-F conjugative transfer system pilin assembly protein TraF [Legionellaceae]|uniref:Conjugative transfer protein TraF n=1 Tax=Legionella bozemanae TaxID=447 RepID=A0A0W0R9H7_LEGBO|nr:MULTISPECIES: type-F conjugative transfer system pilin assembly protein TraF [Legionellaceae]KTC67709.1 conjugative transfer protein TraF [Legionella bozemanae]MCW8497072.1 type-F conjugative transfer system pilin assembly protein TraF [Fluoribacter dumoffii]STO32898.1 conjugal pilus assembly protein TraF [Legionella bozemanae]
MIKWGILLLIFLNSLSVLAEKPVGFLWYSIEKEQKKTRQPVPGGTPFNRLSFTERDAVLRFYTMEALHKARYTKKIEDMRVFLSLQDYWLNESTRFKTLFQKTMLAHPQYDYTVTHPTSNMGTKITDEVRESHRIEVITTLAKSHGLLFFYRGKSPYDLKQIPILADFCHRFRLTLMAISVDGVISPEFPHSKIDSGQANHLGVHYFPALLLVNPLSRKTESVAYGLTTQDVLMERLVQVATQFQGEQG